MKRSFVTISLLVLTITFATAQNADTAKSVNSQDPNARYDQNAGGLDQDNLNKNSMDQNDKDKNTKAKRRSDTNVKTDSTRYGKNHRPRKHHTDHPGGTDPNKKSIDNSYSPGGGSK